MACSGSTLPAAWPNRSSSDHERIRPGPAPGDRSGPGRVGLDLAVSHYGGGKRTTWTLLAQRREWRITTTCRAALDHHMFYPVACMALFIVFMTNGFAEESEAVVPQQVLTAIENFIFEEGFGLGTAWESLEESPSHHFMLGWDFPEFGSAGDHVWEVPLMEASKFISAILWHNEQNGRTRTVIIAAGRDKPATAETGEVASEIISQKDLFNTPALELTTIPDLQAAHQVVAKALELWLAPDERIDIQPAFQVHFSIENFCPVWAWIWPCRIMAGDNELRGLYWLNAASGALRPLAVRPPLKTEKE